MSELTKELEQDKAFIEKVSNKIYSDTDDIEESIPEPKWIGEMTDIAEKYITRFETSYNFANSLADELLASNIDLNDNQKIVLDYLKNEISENNLQYTLWSFTEDVYEKLEIGAGLASYIEAWEKLKEKQKFEVLAAFAQWGLEQEKAE
ncbi:hypothetical protein P7H50_11620 [Enterococcus durans]|uniref:hypothetical protein n=1 Tax=Enterococcus durans TaxID=53345 RepID=UPI0028922CD7|nr:hypothetical protein [Enterococcus durans]MDT2837513.1 hypothetical protein [Enterococcus durans]